MTAYVYTVTSEWDIGLGDVAFSTYEKAEGAARQALIGVGIDDPYDDLVAGGLVHVNTVPVR